jgi:hypothetical protein
MENLSLPVLWRHCWQWLHGSCLPKIWLRGCVMGRAAAKSANRQTREDEMKDIATSVGVVVAGVFVAGLIMNAMRDNSLVKDAINGYDA